jgi:hypothetical protein
MTGGSPDHIPDDEELASLIGDDLGSDLQETYLDGERVYVDLSTFRRRSYGSPPAPRPVPVVDVPSVYGRRLIHMTADGPVYDLRAVSEVFTDSAGSWVRQVREAQWYAWLLTPRDQRPSTCPRAVALPTLNVWVEMYPDLA